MSLTNQGSAGRVLVVSASVGGGHDGVAFELAARLRAQGHEVEVVDFLDAMIWALGWFLAAFYRFQLRFAPWSYDWVYRGLLAAPKMRRPLGWLLSATSGRWLLRKAEGCDLVVSTYPLSSVALGRLRHSQRLDIPVVTFLTDFSVHTMWVHPGVDHHCCIAPESAEIARSLGARNVVVTGPVVPARFVPDAAAGAACRDALAIPADERLAVIVAGAWGAGPVGTTAAQLAPSFDGRIVVACGKNEKLRKRLAKLDHVTPLGWFEDMVGLLNAADVVVHNAGGLTCMESLAVGAPLVSYLPIPGHGKHNARVMQEAGVAPYPQNAAELVDAVAAVTADRSAALAHRRVFRVDAAALMSRWTEAREPATTKVTVPAPRPRRRRVAVMAAAISVLTVGYFGATGGSALAARLTPPVRPGVDRVGLAIRVNESQLANDGLPAALADLGAGVLIDAVQAGRHPGDVRDLAVGGVNVLDAGSGRRLRVPWHRASEDTGEAAAAIAKASGQPCKVIVTSHPDGFTLADAHHAGMRVAVPDAWLTPAQALVAGRLRPNRMYVVDLTDEADAVALQHLRDLTGVLHATQLVATTP